MLEVEDLYRAIALAIVSAGLIEDARIDAINRTAGAPCPPLLDERRDPLLPFDPVEDQDDLDDLEDREELDLLRESLFLCFRVFFLCFFFLGEGVLSGAGAAFACRTLPLCLNAHFSPCLHWPRGKNLHGILDLS